MTITVRTANLADAGDAAAVIAVLDSYASDPRGGSQPLPIDVQARLIPGLSALPQALVLLALDGDQAVGLAIGFFGFSTFAARPLLNIHDLAVVPARRGQGIGKALLRGAEATARARGCCKLTLEVQQNNTPARALYEAFGFRDLVFGDSGPTAFLAKPLN